MILLRYSLITLLLACSQGALVAEGERKAARSATADAPTAVRVDELEATVTSLQSQLQAMKRELRLGNSEMTAQGETVPHAVTPVDFEMIDGPFSQAWCDQSIEGCDGGTAGANCSTHYVTYDNGWVIRPRNQSATPFELRFNLHNQFRYTGFANSVDSFTDAAGNTTPISPRNDFDINRGRWVFSGYAFDPRMQFYTNIDYNTVASNPVLLLLSWISFECNESLTVSMGLGKMSGTWEWWETSRLTLGAERTMATTFFRPSITAGVWAAGKVSDSLSYHLMIGDGFNTFTLRAAELDPNLAFSSLVWWEPWGDFGAGFSDLEEHSSPVVQAGAGLTSAANDADPLGEPGPEQTVIRLSDGTRLVERGVFAPDVAVNRFDITLLTTHLGIKANGCSLATEYFFRWLSDLRGTGPIPIDSLFDHGFYIQGGTFLVPRRLEAYAITSHVFGDFGSGSEYGGGLNWYVNGERGNRFTADFVHINDSPADQDRTGLVAGGSGGLFRIQWWHFF